MTREYTAYLETARLTKFYESISQYLSKTNVQLGASYHTGTQSNTKYEEGYQAAAKYVNAGRDEIGNTFGVLCAFFV